MEQRMEHFDWCQHREVGFNMMALVNRQMRANADAIDAACERALVSGCGVTVVYEDDGSVTTYPDPAVPYGYVYEHRRTDEESVAGVPG